MEQIAVIFGGRSAEHDVSIVTAIANIIKPLELSQRYEAVPVYISKQGSWYSHPSLARIETFRSASFANNFQKLAPMNQKLDGQLSFVQQAKPFARMLQLPIDIVFPAMHGTYGEDGSLMGLLEMANVPYVGCGVAASAIAMDKILAKQLAVANDIAVAKFVSFRAADWATGFSAVSESITKQLTYPLYVKPAHLGSSIGISRVTQVAELENALEVAAHYDDAIIVEEAVPNLIEVTLPVIGNQVAEPAFLERPQTTAEDFFDFDTKYMRGGKKGKAGVKQSDSAQGYSQIPADLPTATYAKAEAVGLAVYKALNCSGIARVDMLIDSKTQQVYFNEINPLPGGLYAHNWRQKGISNLELVERLIDLAKERYAAKAETATVFETNYLQQF